MTAPVTVFLVALLLRAGYVFAFVDQNGLTAEDQMTFVSAAQSILQNGLDSVTTDRGPGYPLFIAATYRLFGENSSVLLAAQAIVDSLTCVLVGILAAQILGRGLVLAGLLSAFNLNMIVVSAMVLTDSLFIFFLTLFLLYLFRFAATRGRADYLLCIAFLGLATTIRSASYYLVPCVLLGIAFWSMLSRLPGRTVATNFLAGIALVAMLLGPQHMRNWQVYGSYDYVSQNGATMLGWIVPGAYQYSGRGSYEQGQAVARKRLQQALANDRLPALPENPFSASRYEASIAKSVLMELGWPSLVKAWFVGSMVNLVAPSAASAPVVRAMDHPSFYGTTGTGVVEKLVNYLSQSSGALYFLILGLGSLTSLLFFLGAARGWWILARRRGAVRDREFGLLAAIAFALMAVYFLLITGPIIGPKYRLPIEPMMTVLLAAAIFHLPRFRATRSIPDRHQAICNL